MTPAPLGGRRGRARADAAVSCSQRPVPTAEPTVERIAMSCMYRRGPGIIGRNGREKTSYAYFVQCAGSCVSLRPGIERLERPVKTLPRNLYETILCRLRELPTPTAELATGARRSAQRHRGARASGHATRDTVLRISAIIDISYMITVQGPRRRGGVGSKIYSFHSVYRGSTCHQRALLTMGAHASSADLPQFKARSHNADRSDAN